MTHAIETAALTKDYGGGRGVFDLDLQVGEGEIYGFLGPNGAGKSTTIKMLMDLIRPTHGTARVLGRNARADSAAVKAAIGYLPGEVPDFGAMRAADVIGAIAGLRRVDVGDRVQQLAERLDLDLGRRFRDLSRGNKQKVGLLLAFMHQPRLLILDEPTGGLDPLMQQEFYALVREARDGGATIFLSSHVLSEVEHICSRVAIIRSGRLVQVLELSALKRLGARHVDIEFDTAPPVAALRSCPGVTSLEVDARHVRCLVQGSVGPLLDALAGTGVVTLATHEPSLEDTFLNLYRSAEPAASR